MLRPKPLQKNQNNCSADSRNIMYRRISGTFLSRKNFQFQFSPPNPENNYWFHCSLRDSSAIADCNYTYIRKSLLLHNMPVGIAPRILFAVVPSQKTSRAKKYALQILFGSLNLRFPARRNSRTDAADWPLLRFRNCRRRSSVRNMHSHSYSSVDLAKGAFLLH